MSFDVQHRTNTSGTSLRICLGLPSPWRAVWQLPPQKLPHRDGPGRLASATSPLVRQNPSTELLKLLGIPCLYSLLTTRRMIRLPVGSFTSFLPSRPVRFAARADIRPMPAFMSNAPHFAGFLRWLDTFDRQVRHSMLPF